jgi:hypothetical protein
VAIGGPHIARAGEDHELAFPPELAIKQRIDSHPRQVEGAVTGAHAGAQVPIGIDRVRIEQARVGAAVAETVLGRKLRLQQV